MQRAVGSFALLLVALSASACSMLTEPEEFIISAEPVPSPNAPPAPAQAAVVERPGGQQMPGAKGG